MGLVSIVIGLGIGVSSQVSTFTCHRPVPTELTCKLVELDLFKLNVKTRPIEKLQGAEAVVAQTIDGEVSTLFISTGSGTMELSSFDSNAEETAIKINDFLTEASQTSLRLNADNRLFSCSFGLILVLVGLFKLFGQKKKKKKSSTLL